MIEGDIIIAQDKQRRHREMELMKQFPKGFFTIPSPIAKPTNNPDDKIIPIKWKETKENKKIKVELAKKKIIL